MSKEQTPITARVEWLSKRIDLESIPNAKELIAFQIKEAVLEALEGFEREWKESTALAPRRSAKEYYETEVKPKYE